MNVPEIYNTYLSVSRGSRGKPWKARKDFTGFNDTPDGVSCKKLEMFFNKFPTIDVRDFLMAPYTVYKDEDLFPLSFYTTQKAIAIYSAMNKQKQEEMPDSEGQIEDIRKSLKYIATICVSRGITLEQFCDEKFGYTNAALIDYRKKLINIYVLIKLPSFDSIVNSLSPQDKELYLQGVHNNIGKFKMRLNTSTRAKVLVEGGLKLINQKTQKQTNTIQNTQ